MSVKNVNRDSMDAIACISSLISDLRFQVASSNFIRYRSIEKNKFTSPWVGYKDNIRKPAICKYCLHIYIFSYCLYCTLQKIIGVIKLFY